VERLNHSRKEIHAFAAIGDFEADAVGFANQANGGPGAAGMAMHVGQTFLHDAEEDQFVFGGKGTNGFGDVEGDLNFAAFGKTGDVPLEGGAEVAGFQRQRMTKIGEGAHLTHDLAIDVGTFVNRLTNRVGEAGSLRTTWPSSICSPARSWARVSCRAREMRWRS